MNKNLLLEIRGRSLKLKSYISEKKMMRKINRQLVSLNLEVRRKGITPKQHELKALEIVDRIMSETKTSNNMAKDIVAQLKLTENHLES